MIEQCIFSYPDDSCPLFAVILTEFIPILLETELSTFLKGSFGAPICSTNINDKDTLSLRDL